MMIEEHWPEADTGEDPPEGPWPDEGIYLPSLEEMNNSAEKLHQYIDAWNAAVRSQDIDSEQRGYREGHQTDVGWYDEMSDPISDIEKAWLAMSDASGIVKDVAGYWDRMMRRTDPKTYLAPTTGPIKDPFRRRGKG
jgi:hypothetical protein